MASFHFPPKDEDLPPEDREALAEERAEIHRRLERFATVPIGPIPKSPVRYMEGEEPRKKLFGPRPRSYEELEREYNQQISNHPGYMRKKLESLAESLTNSSPYLTTSSETIRGNAIAISEHEWTPGGPFALYADYVDEAGTDGYSIFRDLASLERTVPDFSSSLWGAAENLQAFINILVLEAMLKVRNERLAVRFKYAHTWPKAALQYEIDICRKGLERVKSITPRDIVAFTGKTLRQHPPPEEIKFLNNFIDTLSGYMATAAETTAGVTLPRHLMPRPLGQQTDTVTFRLLPSLDDAVNLDSSRALLTSLHRLNPYELVFCLVGDGRNSEIYLTLTMPQEMAEAVEQKILPACYPNLQIEKLPSAALPDAYKAKAEYRAVNSRPLELPFLLRTFTDFNNSDPLNFFCAELQDLKPDQLAMLCIEFEPKTLSQNTPSESKKREPPHWRVAVKLLATAADSHGAASILSRLEKPLTEFTNAQSGGKFEAWTAAAEQQFVKNNEVNYTKFTKYAEVMAKLCMKKNPLLWKKSLLNTDELAALVHLPHKSVNCPQLVRANMKTKSIPEELMRPGGLQLGTAEYRRQQYDISLPLHLRSRHTYIVGASGSGKSNLLKNCIRQDIDVGRGCCVIDPHGDLVSDVLPFIPPKRLTDVIIFNPSDRDFPVSLNPFIPTTDNNRNDVALTFKTAFIRLFNVGDEARRMLNILHFTTLALLEAGGKTFLDLRRFLINPDFRNQTLETVNDPTVLEFWYEEFPHNYPKAAAAPISTRLAQFALSPVTRNILGQKHQAFDLYDLMNRGKILLCSLGKIQEEERQLLGSLLVSQIQLATMRRAEMPENQRRPFVLYIDEFQNFASDAESLEKILSEARKYNLALVLAHQFTSQLPAKLADAIIANAYTKIIFRVGVDDARYLQKALTDYTDSDLQNLEIGQAVMCAGRAQDSFTVRTAKFPDPPASSNTDAIIEHSRKKYGRPRADVERDLRPARPAMAEPATSTASQDTEPTTKNPNPVPAPAPEPANKKSANIFDDLLGND